MRVSERIAGWLGFSHSINGRERKTKRRLRDVRRKLDVAESDVVKLTKVVRALIGRHYDGLPLPPEPLRLHVGTTTSAANFWSQGISSSTRVLEVFGEQPAAPILDWGCGSGRTLRWLVAYDAWREHYRGCDVDPVAIEWLRSTTKAQVAVCKDEPPLPYPDQSFAGVFSFSVLTHIHPSKHRAWYEDLRRVLVPNGLAYLTTAGASTITEERVQLKGPVDRDFAERGFVYWKNEGHYKDAAVVSETFTREQLRGLFTVEEYRPDGYGNMDVFRVRRSP